MSTPSPKTEVWTLDVGLEFDKKGNWQTNERTNRVTTSLLELNIATKNANIFLIFDSNPTLMSCET